jgi:cold shock CspA family protein
MAKSQDSYNKKEKEKKRLKKKKEKLERREQRKLEKEESGPLSFEDMLSYVDEDGNLTSTPPDPTKKKKVIKAEDIVLGVPPRDNTATETVRNGIVKFFNGEKGYGFINDVETNESVFVHVNNLSGPITENDKVTFEVEMGPKGMNAINVNLIKS